jgi:hypothetical protein
MATDALGPVSRHDPYDETANHRHQDYPPAELITGRRNQCCAPTLEKEEVGENSNEPQ